MPITASAVSLNVADPVASAGFAQRHLGFQEDMAADGLLVVFVVDDADAECARLRQEGVAITTPLQTEPWGERFFQVSDPNGVIVQFVQWVATPRDDRC